MLVTYNPESGDRQEWTFDPKRVRSSKAEMIEKRAGENWDQWLVNVQAGSMKARRVLLWHLLTQDHPTLRWEDVPDFLAGEVEIEHELAELREMRERVEKASMSDEDKEPIFAALDGQITEAMERAEAAGVEPEEGKAPSNSDESDTPSPSPKPSEYAHGNNGNSSPPTS